MMNYLDNVCTIKSEGFNEPMLVPYQSHESVLIVDSCTAPLVISEILLKNELQNFATFRGGMFSLNLTWDDSTLWGTQYSAILVNKDTM